MPTPTGLPRTGDRYLHVPTGIIFVIGKRHGSGEDYSVSIRREDGQPIERRSQPLTGETRHVRKLLEAKYWLTMSRDWKLLS
jgi:hypothetical protein